MKLKKVQIFKIKNVEKKKKNILNNNFVIINNFITVAEIIERFNKSIPFIFKNLISTY